MAKEKKKVLICDLTWEELATIVAEKQWECLDEIDTLHWICDEMHKIAQKYEGRDKK